MKLLIAYDGSDCAKAALLDLRRAGLPADSEAMVLTVADLVVPVPMPAGEVTDLWAAESVSLTVRRARDLAVEAIHDARRLAAAGADRIASQFPGWKVQSRADATAPYWAVAERAQEWGADLVVVGSHGRSGLGRLILGSVSQKVLAYAPCSVRIARGRDGATGPLPLSDDPVRILLAVDGSPDAAAAADAVCCRAWPARSEVRVVTAADLKLLSAMVTFGVPAEWAGHGDPMAAYRFRVDAVAAALRQAGLVADGVVREGDPKRVLVEEAERWAADCVFLGAKGHSRLERLLVGSVSTAVAARAHCSVEVVRTS